MRFSTLLLLFCIITGISVLSALGMWQVRRLEWKHQLIEMVDTRRTSNPVSLEEIENIWNSSGDIDFYPTQISGVFDHSKEQFYYVTKDGVVGWHIFTPLHMSDSRIVIVNRGFVPDKFKSADARLDGLIKGEQKIIGLARNAPTQKPNSLVPNNDLENNIYYWKSLSQMSDQVADKSENDFVPFFIDAGIETPDVSDVGYQWPQAGSTRISFSNNHLQYAITWFGLALALLGVGSYFLYARANNPTSKP